MGAGERDSPVLSDRQANPIQRRAQEVTGRKVIAFMSQVHLDPTSAELFVLSPAGEETPSDQEPNRRKS